MNKETTGWLADRPIWAWRCRPARPKARLLLAAPFGEERKCALRLMTAMARRLSAIGLDCLRIDYTGTGESLGAHGEADLAQWRADLSAALRVWDKEPSLPIFGLGARLGGNLLAETPGLAGLCCWEPLPLGSDYVDELRRRRAIKAAAGGGGLDSDDYDGFAVSATLLAELEALAMTAALAATVDRPTLLLHVTGAREPFGAWRALADAVSTPHQFQLIRERPFWGRVDPEPREELFRATTAFFDALLPAGGDLAG